MKLAVIVGTTRQNRQSLREARWVMKSANATNGVEAELVDLIDYPMPFFDEPLSPRYNPERKIDPTAKAWLDKLAEFEAYVFVTPEYNHSIPGVLKNALDYVTTELTHKPVTVVSHGSAGGARATMHLKEILSESRAAVVPLAVALYQMSEKIDEEGNLSTEQAADPRGPVAILAAALSDLKWYSDALTHAREK